MKALLPIAVFLMMVSIGTSLRPGDMRAHMKEVGWRGWARLLIAVFVVPPAVALILARILPLDMGETAGLFLIGVAPGAPMLTRNIARRGFDAQLAATYQVYVALLTPLALPFLVLGAGKLYDKHIWIPPRIILAQVAEKQFVPLLIGLVLMYFAPRLLTRLHPWINGVANGMLVVFLIVILYAMRAELLKITPWVIVATLGVAAASIAIVHALARVDTWRTRTLAICNANRHIGLALLLSGRYVHAKNALPTVACYALVAPVLMGTYSKAFRVKTAPVDATAKATHAN